MSAPIFERFTVRLFLCVLLLPWGCSPNSRVGLGPGNVAPDFELEDLNGKKVKLSDYRGKLTLLNFWASWCVPCMAEMPDLKLVYERLQSKGFQVVAVAVEDDLSAVKELVRKHQLPFPVLFDRRGSSKQKYKLSGYPESFFIDRSNRILMVADPADETPVVRIMGPRAWTSPLVVSRLEQLLSSSK